MKGLPKMPKLPIPKLLPKYDSWGKKRPWMYKFVQRWCNKYNIDWMDLAKIDGY